MIKPTDSQDGLSSECLIVGEMAMPRARAVSELDCFQPYRRATLCALRLLASGVLVDEPAEQAKEVQAEQ